MLYRLDLRQLQQDLLESGISSFREKRSLTLSLATILATALCLSNTEVASSNLYAITFLEFKYKHSIYAPMRL